MFHSYFERENNKILTLNIVHFPNCEISASLCIVLPHLKVSKYNKRPGRFLKETR